MQVIHVRISGRRVVAAKKLISNRSVKRMYIYYFYVFNFSEVKVGRVHLSAIKDKTKQAKKSPLKVMEQFQNNVS